MSAIAVMMADALGVINSYAGATASRIHSLSTSATHVLFNSDGTVTTSGAGIVFDTKLPSNWYVPTTAAVGAGFWVQSVYQSGDALTTDPSSGAWVTLNAGQDWALSVASGNFKSNVTKFSISNSAGGTPVLAVGNITISGDAT